MANKVRAFIEPFRVTNGDKFRLKDIDPNDTRGVKSRAKAEELLAKGVKQLSDMQEKLYAQDRWSLLLIFQAMDAAGKDGAIKHVLSGINPQGCQVYSFKAPTVEDLDHDFMWRCTRCLPERGRIGIFNRSYYEETLVVRVHPEFLEAQRLPKECQSKNLWQERFEDIRNFEKYITRQGVVVLKFFLHVSKKEQRKRLLERLEDPDKNWKFSKADLNERAHWNDYMSAYEDMIRNTATKRAPWYVVPADNKWYTRLVVGAAIHDALTDLDLRFPEVDARKKQELSEVKDALARGDA
ncbi:MAG: polyphosphate kinase 2 family protein [Planctomycetes bacterium]|nr:polyphosphate kinase 2 family protein [Planctomycetota bacterium]